jgi:hypothetical protein
VLARRGGSKGVTGVFGLEELSINFVLIEVLLAALNVAGALLRLSAFVGEDG